MTVNAINLEPSIRDAYFVSHGYTFSPDYNLLMARLNGMINEDSILSKNYTDNALIPFIKYLENLGKEQFDIFWSPNSNLPTVEKNKKRCIERIAEAFLQRDTDFAQYRTSFDALKALQAVVTTTFGHVECPNALAPLAKWGASRSGPSAFPACKIESRIPSCSCGVVTFPKELQTGGILAWASLSHEVAGHHFLHAYPGLIKQLSSMVFKAFNLELDNNALKSDFEKAKWLSLRDYWKDRIEEVACDILGVLNMGSASGIGFLGYARAMLRGKLQSMAVSESGYKSVIFDWESGQKHIQKLEDDGAIFSKNSGRLGTSETGKQYSYKRYMSDVHPLDILRIFSIAKVLENIQNDNEVADFLRKEAENDLEDSNNIFLTTLKTIKSNKGKNQVQIFKEKFSLQLSRKSADLVADVIAGSNIPGILLRRKEDCCLCDLFKWTKLDRDITNVIKQQISETTALNGIKETIENDILTNIENSDWRKLYDVDPLMLEDLAKDDNMEKVKDKINRKFYARHIVAAAVLKSVEIKDPGAMFQIEGIFNGMKYHLLRSYESIPHMENAN